MSKKTTINKAAPFYKTHFQAVLFTIVIIAFLLRLIACLELRGTGMVIRPPATTDMATYRNLALAICQGNFPAFFDYQPFYYVIFLPLAWLFSPDGAMLPVHILQSLIGAATVWLCGASAAKLFGKRAGWIAAGMLALSCYHIFYTPYLLLEVLFAFWSALTLWSALHASKPGARWHWSLIAGLALSGGMLTRGSALLWVPGVLALCLYGRRREIKPALLHSVILLAAFILPVLPFAIHNTRATGKLSGASVAGAKVLILGNSPEAPAGGLEYPRTYHQWLGEEERGGTPAATSMRRWIFSEPVAFLELTFRKMLLFWDSDEIPNNVSFQPHADRSRLLQLPLLLPWGIIAMPALAGLFLMLRRFRQRRYALLLWMCGIVWLATAGFYLLARFRIVALPLLCTAAGGTFMMLWFRRKRIKDEPVCRYCTLLALLISAYMVWLATPFYRDYCETRIFRSMYPNGREIFTDREAVLYDHGPLFVGGNQILGIPPEGLHITKYFPVTQEFRERLSKQLGTAADAPIRQKIMLRVLSGNRRFGNVTVSCNKRTVNALHRVIEERNVTWLLVEFTAPLPSENFAEFTFKLQPNSSAPDIAAVYDSTRFYRRTTIRHPASGTRTLYAGEAVAEWVFPFE